MLTEWENARENCSHTEDTVEMIWKEIRWKKSRVKHAMCVERFVGRFHFFSHFNSSSLT